MKRVAIAIVAVALLGACGDDNGAAEDGGPVTITLVTHDSFAVSEGLLDQFAADTGITVKVLQAGDAGEMVNQAILTKGDPLGDVLYGVDNTFLGRALDEEIFDPYRSPALDDVQPGLEDLTADGTVTPIDIADVCLNYDKQWFADKGLEPPTSLEDLADPAYTGLLVVENPATSSPGLAFMLGTIDHFGEDGWLDYWNQLSANDVEIAAGWEDAYYTSFSGSSGQGPRPIVVSYASSPPAEVVFADPPRDDAPTAVVASSCFRQVEFAGVLAGTEHEAAAQQLVDFMLSPTFQEDMPLNMFVWPANANAAVPEVFTEFSVLPDDPLALPADVIAANRDRWIDEWTSDVMG
jgi:thiamine transport system substrate-binding protein